MVNLANAGIPACRTEMVNYGLTDITSITVLFVFTAEPETPALVGPCAAHGGRPLAERHHVWSTHQWREASGTPCPQIQGCLQSWHEGLWHQPQRLGCSGLRRHCLASGNTQRHWKGRWKETPTCCWEEDAAKTKSSTTTTVILFRLLWLRQGLPLKNWPSQPQWMMPKFDNGAHQHCLFETTLCLPTLLFVF